MWDGWMHGWWGWGMAGMALFWLAVVVAVILAVRALGRTDGRSAGPGGAPRPEDSPLEILKRRYARGEIDREEFEQRKRDLA